MTSADAPGFDEDRVLLVAPTRRDGEVTGRLLDKARVRCLACGSLRELADEITRGVGAVMLTDHALADTDMAVLLAALQAQPAWSDIPVVLLSHEQKYSPPAARLLGSLTNVTMLDRPVSTRSMVSAVAAALRGRKRQYQLRDQLRVQAAAEQALREADKRKDEFLATLAHELRNPLAPLRTGLHLIAAAPGGDARSERVLQMMSRQVAQLVKLIDDLLDVSRIATGKVVLERKRVDMRSVIAAALESTQPTIGAAGHHVHLQLPNVPVWAVGDSSRLEQVLSNLLNNAAKYTPNGGNICVSLKEASGRAVVSVADDGEGIPAAMLPFVFDMFTQVSRNLDRAQGGLGIGLSLVRRLMDLHGGEVKAESAGAGAGSTFTISLPSLAADPAMAELAAPAGLEDSTGRRSVRVLVVDDNRDAADTLTLLLESNGHAPRTAYGGAQALEMAAELRPEVVFCDLGMPGINGYEFASRLRQDARYTSTVLVALTGWGSEDDRQRTQRGGFDFHITKPVGFEDVDGILARL